MSSTVVTKTAAEYEDFSLNWATRGLGADTITDASWEAIPSGLTLNQFSNTDTTTTVWLEGGLALTAYTITNTITTSGGRILQDSFICVVEE